MTTGPRELDPEVARGLIEGQVDVLTEEGERADAFYEKFQCPRCKCPLEKRFDQRTVFADVDALIPRPILRCTSCGYEEEPHTRVIIDSGDASKAPVR